MAGSDVVEAMRLALKPFNIQHLADDWNANRTYLQLSVQRCQHPPAAERCCWGGGVPTPPAAEGIGPSSPGSRLFAAAAPSHLGSCFSGTLEAVVFTAPSSPIHLRRVECWRFTKDL